MSPKKRAWGISMAISTKRTSGPRREESVLGHNFLFACDSLSGSQICKGETALDMP
jgi:hypothetical protein